MLISNDEIKKISSDVEEDRAYALLGFLADLIDAQGSFTNSDGESVRIGDHIYVVGGAVRNFVIGQPVKDIDLVIDANALSTRRINRDAKWFASLIIRSAPSTANIAQTSNDYGVEILHISNRGRWLINGISVSGEEIEIAFARKESYTEGGWKPEEVKKSSIQEDARRREFTFNTLLWSFSDLKDHGPSEEIIQDPLGVGLKDLKNNVIDTPLDPKDTFSDDASRMLRAMKFQFKYGFDLSPRVSEAIKNNPEFLKNVPPEILRNLLTTTILNQPTYKQALEEMRQNNMLSEIINIMKEREDFRLSVRNWVYENKDLSYLFNLLDYELPVGDKLDFLSDVEKGIIRQSILEMSSEDGDVLLFSVRNPGKIINDKNFFMRMFDEYGKELGLEKKDIPTFNKDYYKVISKEIILENPSIILNSEQLKSEISKRLRSSLSEQVDPDNFDVDLITESFDLTKDLIRIANGLDSKLLFKEADIIDNIISGGSKIKKLSIEDSNPLKKEMIENLLRVAEERGKTALLPERKDLLEMDIPEIGKLFSMIKDFSGERARLEQQRSSLKRRLLGVGEDMEISSENVDEMPIDEVMYYIGLAKDPEKRHFERAKSIIKSLDFIEGEHVSIFDFDDTLAWNEAWHTSVITDNEGYVERSLDSDGKLFGAGKSHSVGRALNLLNNIDSEMDFRLKEEIVDMEKLGKYDQTVYRVVAIKDGEEVNISIDDLISLLGAGKISNGAIDIRKKYVDFPAVTTDNEFYQDPDNLGGLGINQDIFQKYIEASSGKVIILTARAAATGMKESIEKIIIENGGRPPDYTFVRPRGGSGASHKGNIILQIAEELGPSGEITFFDDNLSYIDGVESAISGREGEIARVNIIKVDTSEKPKHALNIIEDLVKIAHTLDSKKMYKEADILDNFIIKISEEGDEEVDTSKIEAVIWEIFKQEKRLLSKGLLVTPPPSREELMEQGFKEGIKSLRKWFPMMIGRVPKDPDVSKKKDNINGINKKIDDLGLSGDEMSELGLSYIDISVANNISHEDLAKEKDRVSEIAQNIKATRSSSIIKIPISLGSCKIATEGWVPPEGFSMLKGDSCHVTILSVSTVSMVKESLSSEEYSDLASKIYSEISFPAVELGSLGLAVRPGKRTFALSVVNQEQLREYRDEVINFIANFISDSSYAKKRSINPMNWWLKADPYEKNRFFHVSVANDGDGWPTNSIPDISEADIQAPIKL